MKDKARWIVAGAIVLLLLAFIIGNREPVDVWLIFGSFTTLLAFVIFISAALGAAAMWTVLIFKKKRDAKKEPPPK